MRLPTQKKLWTRIRLAYAIMLPGLLLFVLVAILVVLLWTRDPTLAAPLLLPFLVIAKLLSRCMIWFSNEQEREFFKSEGISRLVATYCSCRSRSAAAPGSLEEAKRAGENNNSSSDASTDL